LQSTQNGLLADLETPDRRAQQVAAGSRHSEESVPADSRDIVLDVRHLSVEYAAAGGPVHAVDDVSFSLSRGQIFGLAGESGSGKSTLAYAVARLLRPPARVVRGEVLFYPQPGSDVHRGSSSERPAAGGGSDSARPVDVLALTPGELRAFRWRRLSIVFQSAMNALNPVLDIGTQIADVLRAHYPAMGSGARGERVAELLRLVGIAPDRRRSFPHELSGGMRQRAVIAIALALNPEIIIMDEPTTALDVVVQREILAEILDLRDRLGFSVIFITHDLSLLLEIADHLAIMYAGRIVETGTRASLHRTPLHPYTDGLLHSFPTLRGPRGVLTGIPGTPPDLRAIPLGCAFQARCALAFDACTCAVPALQTPAREECGVGAHATRADGRRSNQPATLPITGQRVACHLYDPSMAGPEVPARHRGGCQETDCAVQSPSPTACPPDAPTGDVS
jgi:peptide/nickel transport system ATP-binding protein